MTIVEDVLLGCRAREHLSADGRGTIVGVFSSSFYCRIEGRGIVLFHGDRYGSVPFGVGCRNIESLMAGIGPEPGQAFSCRDMALSMPAAGFTLILRPLPAPAASAGPDGGQMPGLLPPRAIRENLAAADRALETRKGGILAEIASLLGFVEGGGLAAATPGRAPRRAADLWTQAPFVRLLRAIGDGDKAVVEEVAGRMMGLGTGLTPTLDDLLVGMAYTVGFLGRRGYASDPRVRLLPAAILSKARAMTTEISAAYLESAASGEVFSLLEAVEIALLAEGGKRGLETSVDSLLEVGSDSGANMLTGILLAIPLCLGSINLIYGVSK
jgi:hypothetical protein